MPFATEIRRDEAARRRARAEHDEAADPLPSTEKKDNATDPRRRNKQRRGPAENKRR